MKKIILLISLMMIISTSVWSREPKATICDRVQIESSVKGFLRLYLKESDLSYVEIRSTELIEMAYDLNDNEVTTTVVKWGYKEGETSDDTYSLQLRLSSSALNYSGKCKILSVIQSEKVE